MLTYKNSYEAMKYQQSIEREKTSFEKLIQFEKEQVFHTLSILILQKRCKALIFTTPYVPTHSLIHYLF